MDRRKLIVGAAAAVLVLGGGGAAIAAQQGALPGQEDDPNITGTVSAPGGNEGAEGHENEAGGQFEGLARIDRAAAEKAALGAVPGEVKETELENENGFVVYGVEIQGKDGTLHEVVVDAGNGKILAQEMEDD
jgi:uncharacterized membrane protein YkoI